MCLPPAEKLLSFFLFFFFFIVFELREHRDVGVNIVSSVHLSFFILPLASRGVAEVASAGNLLSRARAEGFRPEYLSSNGRQSCLTAPDRQKRFFTSSKTCKMFPVHLKSGRHGNRPVMCLLVQIYAYEASFSAVTNSDSFDLTCRKYQAGVLIPLLTKSVEWEMRARSHRLLLNNADRTSRFIIEGRIIM